MVEQIVIPFNICKPPILAPERCVLGRTCSQGAVDGQVVREVLSGLWTNGGMFLARLGTGFRPKGDGRPVVQAEGYMKNAYTSMIQYAYKWLKLLQYIYIYIYPVVLQNDPVVLGTETQNSSHLFRPPERQNHTRDNNCGHWVLEALLYLRSKKSQPCKIKGTYLEV